jgi:sugar transferase (PEP-CTERM system associated)
MSTVTSTSTLASPAPAPAAWRVTAKGAVGAWRCLIVRADGFVLRVELLLLAMALAAGASAVQAGILSTPARTTGAALLLLACRGSFYAGGVHRMLTARWLAFLAALARSSVLAMAAASAGFLAAPRYAPPAAIATAIVISSLMSFVLLRVVVGTLIRHRALVDECLILGGAEKAERFFQELLGSDAGRVLQVADGTADASGLVEYGRVQQLTAQGSLSLIVVSDAMQAHPELQSLLVDCKLRGLSVEDAIDSYERLAGKIWVEGLRPDWLIYSQGFRHPSVYRVAKRTLDIAASVALLLIAAPLMLLVAAAIKLESPGPALFAQERVGHYGRTFTLYKFRSMRNDAEASSGPVWAGEQDTRITRLGRILRKCRVDELPQVWNVLRGEMSFVGPRPERPYFVGLLKEHVPFYDLRHYVQPGITGWAQVKYPYGASIEDALQKLQYDLYYRKHMSLLFDVVILLKTVQVVLMGRGAR